MRNPSPYKAVVLDESNSVENQKKLEAYLKPRQVLSVDDGQFSVLVDALQYVQPLLAFSRERVKAARPAGARAGHIDINTTYFLSHAHSDHYMGLYNSKATFTHKIFCSEVTAKLMGVMFPYVQTVPLSTSLRYDIDVRDSSYAAVRDGSAVAPADRHHLFVELLDANHCPGAVCLVFTTHDGKTIVHTGDFRFNGQTVPVEQRIARAAAAAVAAESQSKRQQQKQPPMLKQAETKSRRISGSLGPSNSKSSRPPAWLAMKKEAEKKEAADRKAVAAVVDAPLEEQTAEDRREAALAAVPAAGFPFCVDGNRLGDSSIIHRIKGSVHRLFLDNTYCDSAYTFSPQEDTLRELVVDVAERMVMATKTVAFDATMARVKFDGDARNNAQQSRPVFNKRRFRIALCSSMYTIGKERVPLALHAALGGNLSFVASNSRAKLLRACDLMLAPGAVAAGRVGLGGANNDDDDNNKQQQQQPQAVARRSPVFREIAHNDFKGNADENEDVPFAQLLTRRRVVDPQRVETRLDPERSAVFRNLAAGGTIPHTSLDICVSPFVVGMRTFNYRSVAASFDERLRKEKAATHEQSAAILRSEVTDDDEKLAVTMSQRNGDVVVDIAGEEEKEDQQQDGDNNCDDDDDPFALPPRRNALHQHPAAPKQQQQQQIVKTKLPALFAIDDDYDIDLNDFDLVLVVEPTGWAMGPQKNSTCVNQVSIVRYAYSEHSSFDELVAFVALLQPQHVVPTVSCDHYAKFEPLFALKNPRLRLEYSRQPPIDLFLRNSSALQLRNSSAAPANSRDGSVRRQRDDGNDVIEVSSQPMSLVAAKQSGSNKINEILDDIDEVIDLCDDDA